MELRQKIYKTIAVASLKMLKKIEMHFELLEQFAMHNQLFKNFEIIVEKIHTNGSVYEICSSF